MPDCSIATTQAVFIVHSMTPKQLAIQETQSQCHENTTLPFVLRIALQPLASVHRSFSDYSLRWRRPDPSLVMRRHPQSEDVQLSPDKMTLEGLTSSENEDLNQKYGQHGRIPSTTLWSSHVSYIIRDEYPADSA